MKILLTIVMASTIVLGCMSANKSTHLLIDDMRSTDRETRLSAVWLLGQHGEKAVPALIEVLNDQDKGIQYAAMFSLATIGSIDAKEALTKILPILDADLKAEDKEIRKTAAELLQVIGTPDAHAILNEHGLE